MKFIHIITACLLIGVLTNKQALAQTSSYTANYAKSSWESTASRLQCKLTHTVPEYGSIEFIQEAGLPEGSLLHVWYGRGVSHSRAQINFVPPSWQAHIPTVEGWKFTITTAGEPVVFSSRQSRRILDAIAQGLLPTITHTDNNNRSAAIKASLSSVRFNQAYQQYSACQLNIVPVTFEEVRNSAVYFENASIRLDPASMLWLSYVLEYVKDPAVTRIELGGFTDSIGSFRANHQLASQRVERVRDYFTQNGIDEKMLRLKVYGEMRAQASNSTAEGRAKNRRVSIKIYR